MSESSDKSTLKNMIGAGAELGEIIQRQQSNRRSSRLYRYMGSLLYPFGAGSIVNSYIFDNNKLFLVGAAGFVGGFVSSRFANKRDAESVNISNELTAKLGLLAQQQGSEVGAFAIGVAYSQEILDQADNSSEIAQYDSFPNGVPSVFDQQAE